MQAKEELQRLARNLDKREANDLVLQQYQQMARDIPDSGRSRSARKEGCVIMDT
jgi:hypothetical protein